MGKLNIAHHKSYHPYRLDNIERVRLDEAAAKRKQTEDIDRALAAVRPFSTHRPRTPSNPFQDAESRLSTLRARAGITPPSSPPRSIDADSSAIPIASGSAMPLSNGHINLFADIEEHAAALAARASKSKPAMTDLDRGIPLAPTKQDLQPWYSAAGRSRQGDKIAEARRFVLLASTFPGACCCNKRNLPHHQTAGPGTPTESRPAFLDPIASQAALAPA
jgi:hypothetical protein